MCPSKFVRHNGLPDFILRIVKAGDCGRGISPTQGRRRNGCQLGTASKVRARRSVSGELMWPRWERARETSEVTMEL